MNERHEPAASRRPRRVPTALTLAALLAAFLALVWSAERRKSDTIDEGLFIGGGVAQVKRLDPNFDVTHPPLLRWVAGLSAIVLGGARLPTAPPPMTPAGAIPLREYEFIEVEFDWTPRFFYDAPHDPARVLFWGRFPFALLGGLAALIVFREARRFHGEIPALGAAALFLFTPEVLAHSQWAHSDIAAALTTLIVALALARATERPSTRTDLLLGAALGLAVLAKITALALVPLALVVVGWFDRRRAKARSWTRLVGRLATIALVVWAILVVGYLPRPRLFGHEFLERDVGALIHAPPEAGVVDAARAVLRVLPLPDGFLKGAGYTRLLAARGQVSYFHGESSTQGWWYYYPVALLLKYPTPLLALALVGLLVSLGSARLGLARKVAWIAPPLVILLLSMTNRVNIGVRSVLPMAPFFALWAGAALEGARAGLGRRVAIGLWILALASGALAYPNFLAYFNPLAGGTPAAHRWLVDSNLDWGQDLPELADAIERRRIEGLRLAYFGAGRPAAWGVEAEPISGPEPGWFAVSRSYLSGWWPPHDPYAWLRRLEPDELVGGSIALFHIEPSELPGPAELASPSPAPAAAPATADPEAEPMRRALALLYERHEPAGAVAVLDSILARNPRHYGALWQRAAALDSLGGGVEAREAWREVVALAESEGYVEGLDHARMRVAELGP